MSGSSPRSPGGESGQGGSPWQGLSSEAMAALTQGALGPSAASQLLSSNSDGGTAAEIILDEEVRQWVEAELEVGGEHGKGGALKQWQKYEDLLGVAVPGSVEDLLEQANPNLQQTFGRLLRAKRALTDSGETTPTGLNVGETMHLVLVPWQAYQTKLAEGRDPAAGNWELPGPLKFESWLRELMRQRKDLKNLIDVDRGVARPNSNGDLYNAFEYDRAIYRDPQDPTERLKLSRYLADRIQADGEWGVVLAQTGQSGGYLKDGKKRAADEYTAAGQRNFRVAGHNVDSVGVFEWISLVCQEINGQLSDGSFLLLANRSSYHLGGLEEVPVGTYSSHSNKVFLGYRCAEAEAGDFTEEATILGIR